MKRFKNILLVINRAVENATAIQKSVHLCLHNQARLTVIEVLEESHGIVSFFDRASSTEVLAAHLKERQESLQALLAPYCQDVELEVMVVRGRAFLEVIRAVLQRNCDLVVRTCHTHGSVKTILFGATDMHLLRKCPCPLWLIKPQEGISCRRLLAAVDLEPAGDIDRNDALNQQILEVAVALALSESAELHIVHAWAVFGKSLLQLSHSESLQQEVALWVEDQQKEINAVHAEFKAKLDLILQAQGGDDLRPELHFLEGPAEIIIPRLAEEKKIDMVIMGTIARTGLPGFFMGNTAESILNQLNCSVLAVKPAGFVSPVEF